MELIFATNNKHKLLEIRNLVSDRIRILSLSEAGITTEIPEDHFTLEENALQKARFIHKMTGENCLADDTGLEVFSLNNEPGVFSARYSQIGDLQFPGMEVQKGNVRKLLTKLKDEKDRRARFRTVISLIYKNSEYQFEGIARGIILSEERGNEGFGYDPVFNPEGTDLSFAEMPLSEKNKISHRAKAMEELVNFLKQIENNS